jgi:PAS domain S-box-containing protein
MRPANPSDAMTDAEIPKPEPELTSEQLRVLLEGLGDHAIFSLDAQGRILTWNRGASRISRYAGDEVIGRPFSMLFSPEDAERGLPGEILRKAHAERVSVEGWRLRKDGGRFWAYSEISAVRDPDGAIAGYVEITCDISEQKASRDTLTRSEESFRLLVDSVLDYSIYMLDRRGNVVSWNKGAERIKGYAASEILGEPYSRFYTPEDLQAGRPQQNLRTAAEQGHYEGEGWRVRKDGSRFWACVVLTALRDENGHIRGFAKVTRDISGRKRTEDLLRQSEERFRLLVDGIKDYAVFMLSPEGLITSWNPGAERIKGYHADEVIGKHFSMFYPDQDVAAGKPERALRTATEQGRYAEQGWRVRRDGSLFWADVTLTPIRDESGKLRGFSKVTRDVTEQKKAQEDLRHAEERLRQLLDGIRECAIFLLDPDGRVATWNAGAERLKGYRAEEILGKPFSTFYPSEDRESGKPGRLLEIALSEGQAKDEGWRVRKDGSRFWAEVLLTAVYDAGGLLQGFSKITRDRSERRQREEEVQRLNRELRERVTDLDAFASTLAHDVEAPLRAVTLFTELALEDCAEGLGEHGREMLRRVLGSAGQAGQLTRDLLAYSRLTHAEIRSEPVDLGALIEEVLLGMAHVLTESKASVEVRKPLPEISANKVLLRQALTNLLSNAVKFSRAGVPPVIKIRAAREGPRVRIVVEDNGIGVAPEDAKRLFQAFNRLNPARDYAGTGLGLAIVRRSAERMGGRVGMESGPSGGCRFWIELPGVLP